MNAVNSIYTTLKSNKVLFETRSQVFVTHLIVHSKRCQASSSCQITSPASLEPNNIKLNRFGWTPLHTACFFGQLKLVQYLVQIENADVNETNINGWHSLIFAVYGGHLDVVDYLLYETDVLVQIRDSRNQRNAKDIAELLQDREITELLEEHADHNSSADLKGAAKNLLEALQDY